MTDDLSIAIPLAIACVLVSAFCSGTEVALFSLRRVDRDQLGKSTNATDRWIVKLLERPRRLIATVLIMNEVCTALLAVLALGFACATCSSPLVAFFVALGVTLPLVVLISEVTAKTLAAKVPFGWARVCTPLLWVFTLAITPVRVVIGLLAEIFLRPLGGAARSRPARDLSEEEFRHLVDAGSAQGQVDARERRLIHRVFEFSDKNVGQVMTPRDRIFALAYDLPMQRLVKELAGRGFSRVPIYQKSLDNIRGIVNAKDLVRVATDGGKLGKPLGEVLHEPLFVPRTTPVKRLFLTFKQKKVHMAVVVSEYGKVLGLVTMDDLLAQIFGVLRDERAELQQRKRPPGGTPAPGVPTSATTEAAGVIDGGGRGEDAEPSPGRFGPLDESRPVPREDADEISRPITDPGIGVIDGPSRAAEAAEAAAAASEGIDGVIDGGGPSAARTSVPGVEVHDEETPPAVDVELMQTALATTPTERAMLGLPSRTTTIPPMLRRHAGHDASADVRTEMDASHGEAGARGDAQRRGVSIDDAADTDRDNHDDGDVDPSPSASTSGTIVDELARRRRRRGEP